MPLLPPRKGRTFSYEDQATKVANVRRAEALVTQLLDAGDDPDAACAAAQAIWEAAPRAESVAAPLDLAPWIWLRDAAADGHRLGENVTTVKIALAAEVWHVLVARDVSLEARSNLRRPDADIAVDLFSAGLGCIVGADRRYPLFVLKKSTYNVEPLTRIFAERLLELRKLGINVDPATTLLAEAVVRG